MMTTRMAPFLFLLTSLAGVVSCGSDGGGDAAQDGSDSGTDAAGVDAGVDSAPGSDASPGVDASSGTDSGTESGTGQDSAPDSATNTDAQPDAETDSATEAGDDPVWAHAQIHYTGPSIDEFVELDNCYFCDASDIGTHRLLRFQQGNGWTIWALYVPSNASLGTSALAGDYNSNYVTLSESDSSLPDDVQGFYQYDTNAGTVTYTELDLGAGGVVAGSIDATLQQGDVSAHLQATFYAELP